MKLLGPRDEEVLRAVAAAGAREWFVDDPGAFGADWSFAFETASLLLIGAVVLVAVAWHVVGGRLPRPELPFLEPLGRLAPWIPRLLGVHLGVSLLSLAVQDAYLAPNLSLEDVPGGAAIAFAEGLLGVWFITGAWLRPPGGDAAAGAAGGAPGRAGGHAGGDRPARHRPVPGRAATRPRPLRGGEPVAGDGRPGDLRPAGLRRAGPGAPAFSEKFANPALAREFIGNYPAFDLFDLLGIPLSDDAFIRMAGAIELLFGLLLISGRIPQVAVIVAGIPFNATLFFLGRDRADRAPPDLRGHARPAGVRLVPHLRRRGAGLAAAVAAGRSPIGLAARA